MISVGDSTTHNFVVSEEDYLTFQKLSQDTSRIHTDKEFAESRGCKDVICYGGLMLAHLSHVLGMQIPGQDGMSLKWEINYRKPLYIGEEAEVQLKVTNISHSTGVVESNFKIVNNLSQTIATGKTQSIVPKDKLEKN